MSTIRLLLTSHLLRALFLITTVLIANTSQQLQSDTTSSNRRRPETGTENYSRNFDDRRNNWDANRNFDDPNRSDENNRNNFDGVNRNFGDTNNRNFGDTNRNFGDPNRNLGDPNRNSGDSNRNFGDPNRNFDNTNRNFGDPNRNFDDANRNFDDPNRNLDDTNRNFGTNFDGTRRNFSTFDNNDGSGSNPNRNSFDNTNFGSGDVNRDRDRDNDFYNPLDDGRRTTTPRPSWLPPTRGGFGGGGFNDYGRSRGGPSILDSNLIINEATYFIVASRMVRPGSVYRVSATVFQSPVALTIRASIARDGVEISSDSRDVKVGNPETLLMRVPTTTAPGEYKLRVDGLYNSVMGGLAFFNETKLTFSQRSMTIFVQTDKPVYMQGQTVRFRTIPINTELKAYDNAVDVYMLDPNRHIMRRWLSRQSNLGTVSLEYQLSDQPVFGQWIVKVVAQGQVEEATFLVEEYYQTRFEVNVTMPAFFFNTDRYIYGKVMANYTSGAPVRGNLTLKATIRPIARRNQYGYNQYNLQQQQPYGDNRRYGNQQFGNQQYGDNRQYSQYGGGSNVYGPQNYPNYDQNRDQNDQSGLNTRYYDERVVEKVFTFNEEWPFWMPKPYDYYSYGEMPYLRFFNGTYYFQYPMSDLEQYVPNLDGMEVQITATVGERFMDEVIEGFSIARIYNSSMKVSFLGDSPQVFKPSMPFTCYIVAEFHDGSPLPFDRIMMGRLEISGHVESRSGGRRELPVRDLVMSEDLGVWEFKVDLKHQLGMEDDSRAREYLNEITSMRLTAYFKDGYGERTNAELLLITHHSPLNQHIKVSTSTTHPKVGEYIILHIQSNFYMESFQYIVMSKGLVLLSGKENMQNSIRTFAVTLSAEMAPAATIVVWHVGARGKIMADSLTFPVNGISRNNFTVFINNRKARTGRKVEVAIYGEPGAYVGLSGIDRAFYTMQAGNELTYAQVITKMASFDEQTNGTFKHTWLSHEGDPDDLVYYPSSTFGIDANRTFEYAGLAVFTDIVVPRRQDNCNYTFGLSECLTGRCYRTDKRCDGVMDCEDGTDEANCRSTNNTSLLNFRKFRFNRIQWQYENVWLWKDINIGPHGRYIFNIDVPERPAHWMISAFSVSPSKGFGMLQRAIEYVGVLPFFINVEMPDKCRQGEQVGIRVSVFNYMLEAIEATVVLQGSPDYKFVHVEEDGIVRSYNPRTSFGEHQFFIYIPQQDAAIVHLPIVPTRLGELTIRIYATTLVGKDEAVRKLYVEPDGVPQYRHQSILLDLSNRAYFFQYMHVNITETPIIPYEVDRYYVYGSNRATLSVVGDVVGPIFPTMPVNATSLLDLPMDSAEQNMFSFAANLYTTMYMRLISQRNRTLERNSFYHMNIGYQRQLSFMNYDGSFSLFRSDWNQSASSVWLTAYCTRVLQEASFYEWENFIYIDPGVIGKAVDWILRHQTTHGSFYEITWSPDRKVNGTLNWPNDQIAQRNITLTAHVLITLASVKDLSGSLGSRVSLAQQQAISWLERNIRLLEEYGEPYDVALVAYALMLSKASNAEAAFGILARHARIEGGLMYWGKEAVPLPPYKLENQKPFLLPRLPYKYDSMNIETTAYALMTYVARHELMVDPIVKWLNAQRLTDGGWASTQDTGMAMKALCEYTTKSRLRDVSSLTITVEASSIPGHTQNLYVTDKNLAQLQTIEIPNAWGTVKVQAKGAGYAILQMTVQYNVDIAQFQTQPPVRAFALNTHATFHGRNQSHITYVSCQSWINQNESIRSGMAVLDVAIPTGYIIQQQKLDAYILSRRVRNLQRARYQPRKVLFYFDYLDEHDTCVNFTIERWHPVANMSRYLPIRVYEYYSPERFNETIFDALPTYLLNICEVCGSSQCPYCSIYNAAISSPIPSLIVLLVIATTVVFRNWTFADNTFIRR